MEAIIKKQNMTRVTTYLLASLLGAGLITLGALVKIPFYPVPFTLQTFAIVFLGLTQRPSQAFGSVITYLVAATVGLPVLNGGVANLLWFAGPTAGYLIAFPFAACLIAYCKTRIHPLLAILMGQILIFASGFGWLATLIGAPLAWSKGVFLFLASDALKDLGAFGAAKIWKKLK
jgi:biotin transport system substrate-specific component